MRALLVVLLLVSPAFAGDSEPVVLFDFETGRPTDGWNISGLTPSDATVEEGKTPSGGSALTLVGEDDRKDRVGYIYQLVKEKDWRAYETFSLHAKVEAKQPIEMRLFGWDGRGGRGILHRFTLPPGDWREVLLPLNRWREEWRNTDHVGDFRRISGLELRWDDGTGTVTIDDLRLIPGDRDNLSCRSTDEDRLTLAFPNGKTKIHESEHLKLFTNATRFKGKEGKKLLVNLERVATLLDERYGIGGPTDLDVNLIVYRKAENYRAFFPRLGSAYGAKIPEPTGEIYSILDVIGTTYSAEYGCHRPDIAHEVAHGLVRIHLGLTCNGNWVQEAIATSAVRTLCPEAVPKVNFLSHFAARRDGVGPFLPLAELCAKKLPGYEDYAQLSSLADYFAEKHAKRLPQIWGTIRDHDKRVYEGLLTKIATALGTTVTDLQTDWIQWGIAKYRPKK